MVSQGLLIRLEVKPGRDADVEKLMLSLLPLVRLEATTKAWFAIRFGRSEYGIFDAFPDSDAREAHLGGEAAHELLAKAEELCTGAPKIQKLVILASKLPTSTPGETDTKALLLTFKAKAGHEADVEKFLRDAEQYVRQEPRTTAWFAIQLENGDYGVFDAFPDNGARFSHLTGHVPRELAKHSLSLLGSLPDMEMAAVVAEKVGL